MTTEERFERIEHVTSALAEERRRDREEYKALWRESQRQIDKTQRQLDQLGATVTRMAEEFGEADERLQDQIDKLAAESRAADARLEARLETLISAIGQFIAKQQ